MLTPSVDTKRSQKIIWSNSAAQKKKKKRRKKRKESKYKNTYKTGCDRVIKIQQNIEGEGLDRKLCIQRHVVHLRIDGLWQQILKTAAKIHLPSPQILLPPKKEKRKEKRKTYFSYNQKKHWVLPESLWLRSNWPKTFGQVLHLWLVWP